MTTGMISGDTKNACSRLRPQNRPRTSANDTGRPSAIDNTITVVAILALVQNAATHRGSTKSSRYHRNVQLGGGNCSHCDEPNDSSAIKTIGSSRKMAVTTPMT